MKALTIDPLWAWAIVHDYKWIENRVWRTHYRGRLVIHAARNVPRQRQDDTRTLLEAAGVACPTEETLDALRGCLVGAVDVTDCVEPSTLPASVPFASGPFCWCLANAVRFAEPIVCRGGQSLWNVPADLEEIVNGADSY